MYHTDKSGNLVEAPIHAWFGLGRDGYFVIPRLALQELPLDWQQRFIALMNEARTMGLRTPQYIVLRRDAAYTHVAPYDPDDDTSREYEFTSLRDDEWANYRRGSVKALCDTFEPK